MPLIRKNHELPEEPHESDDYPSLADMVGAYFHEDYHLTSEDPDEIVAYVKEVSSLAYVQQLVQDIQRCLAKYGQSESELDAAFDRVFTPQANFRYLKDRTQRESLEKVIEILSNPPKTE